MNLLILGETLLDKTKMNSPKSWINIVKSRADVNLYNKTVSRCQVEEVIGKLDIYVNEFNPDFVFILCGTQDAILNKTPNHIYNSIIEVINECTNRGLVAVVILQPLFNVELVSANFGIPERDLQNSLVTLKRYRRLIEDYCFEANIGIMDFEKAFIENDSRILPEKYYTDGFHLTEYAHEMIAEKFIARYKDLLTDKDSKRNFSNIQINTIKK